MAQTGYTPILIYSSSTGGNTPAAGNLTNSSLGSELAINITDGKLFYKDNANAIQVIGWKVTPTSAGGTGLTSYTAGDMLYYASGTALSKLAIGSSGAYMSSSGTAPQWTAPAALTKTDDTNVTLTLGGSASTALLNAASLTLGWTGQLATTRGGTGLSSFTANGVLYASSTSALATGSSLLFDGTAFTVGTTSIGNARIALQASASNDANEPELNFYSAVFANLNKPKAKSANGTLALLLESGSTSTFQKRARLRLDGGGAATATIQTSTDNGSTYTDQFIVDGAGNVLVGNTSNYGVGETNCVEIKGQYIWAANNTGSASNRNWAAGVNGYAAGAWQLTSSSANNNWPNDAYRFAVTIAGSCYNTTGTYGTLSDERFKENVSDARGYAEDLMKVRVVKYSLKEEESQVATKLGVIAQELEQIFPNMIDIGQTPNGDEFKSVKMTVFLPMLIKAFQELKQEIDALKGTK